MAVGQDGRAFGDHCLRDVRLREGPGSLQARPALLHRFECRLVEPQFPPEDFCYRGRRHVVGGRTEPACSDDSACSLDCLANRSSDVVGIVTDSRTMRNLDSDRGKLSREMRRVGVDGETEQQLVADCDDLDLHVS